MCDHVREIAVLNALNERYHVCLCRAQELTSLGLPSNEPQLAMISAERLMYNHALELCQTAALDELFGNPQLVRLVMLTFHVHTCHVTVFKPLSNRAHTVALSVATSVQRRRSITVEQM
jgi:hypothetical protein